MLAEADAIKDEMGELAGLRRGRVRLGAPPTLCISLVAEALSSFHSAHPGVDLHLTEGGSRLLVEQLAVGAVDIALVTQSDGPTPAGVSLTHTPLLAEELVVISSAAAAPVTHGPSVSLTHLATLPLIAFDESYELRATLDAAFRTAGLTPTLVLEGAEMDAVLRFVERGVGVAVVPAMVLFDRPLLRSARLSHPAMARTVSLAHRSDVTPAIAVAALRAAIVSTAAAVAERDPAITSLL
jgi:DNA-binding transcriptional LysR family regulator